MRAAETGAFLLASLLAADARADSVDQAVRLSWNAPPACPSSAAVMNDVARILGASTTHHANVRADVTELGPERWSVHLVTDVDGAPGERSLEANSCEAVATATALIVAWTVDPARARARATIQPTPEPATAPKPAPQPESPSEPPVRVVVAASGIGGLGTLPSAGLAGEITVGALFGPLRVELGGEDWITQDATAPSGEGTHIHLLETALRGCYRGRFTDRFEIDPCAGTAIFFASSNGFGESQTFQRSSAWDSLEAALLSSWRFAGPLSLRATVGLGVPLARPPFVLLDPSGVTALHRVSLITAQATLGLEARFP